MEQAIGIEGDLVIWPSWLVRKDWRVTPTNWLVGRRLRIAVFADPHAGGPQMPAARLWEAVAAVNSLDVDLITVMGDYVADHACVTSRVPVTEVARAIATLRARRDVYAIIGNHDWRADPVAQSKRQGPVAYARLLAEAGVTVLENAVCRIDADGQALWVLGLGCQRVRRARRLVGGRAWMICPLP